MIELNRIRSTKTLETMKKDLSEFITNPAIVEIYEEQYGWGPEDYEADKEQAIDLLVQVEKRLLSLTNFNQRAKKQEKCKKSEKEATPSSQ